MDLGHLREDYELGQMDEGTLSPDPLLQFQKWLTDAIQEAELKQTIVEPNAMTLSTCTKDGVPSARMVLLKGVDKRGFTFFTNYESQKGHELADNPKAALVFWWGVLQRQVRIVGDVEKLSDEESTSYFHTRPEKSQRAACVGIQSSVIPNREVLVEKMETLKLEYEGKAIPRPAFWGGYRVVPSSVEFWQGRRSRLHDRLKYIPKEGCPGLWSIIRLSP